MLLLVICALLVAVMLLLTLRDVRNRSEDEGVFAAIKHPTPSRLIVSVAALVFAVAYLETSSP